MSLVRKLLFFFALFFYNLTFSQQSITGVVVSLETNKPVPFAFIKVSTQNKTITCNENGDFKLTLPNINATLSVSSIGYATTTYQVKNTDTVITIFLETAGINLSEVNVYANRGRIQASSLETLKSSESYNLAGTTKDIFRSVQMLPGVSSNNAASAQYNVRGGTYDENLVLVNGIEVAEPYHIKIFPMASVGIFNIDLVNRIDFSSGGFSAEYGDALSSVMNVEYRKANHDSITGRVSLGMIDMGLVAEIPTSKKSSLLIGARHSYLDPVVKMIDPVEKVSIRYYDIQSKFDYDINVKNKVSILAIYSQDYDKVGPQLFSSNYTGNGYFNNKPLTYTNNYRKHYLLDANYNDLIIGLTSRHIISSRLVLNSELSYYREKENNPENSSDTSNFIYSDSELFKQSNFYYSQTENYDIANIEYKISGKIMITQNHNSKIGLYIRKTQLEYKRENVAISNYYNNTSNYPDTFRLKEMPTDFGQNSSQNHSVKALKYGGYITHLWQINNKLSLNLGLRSDFYEINRELDLSPRSNISYKLSGGYKISAAWGVFYKSPLMKQLKYSYNTTDNTKSQKATHYLIGIEKKFDNKTIKLETYYKKYDNLIPLQRNSQSEIIYTIKDNSAEGYATGIDFQYVLTGQTTSFWFNYSLTSAKERLKGTSHYYSRYTDQLHSLSSLLMFKLKNKRELGFKVTYGSGYAYQTKVFDIENKSWIYTSPLQTASLPYYLSIDVRFKKHFTVFRHNAQFYIDIMNLLNRKNSIGHRYWTSYGQPQEENVDFLGILPTFGFMFDF